MVNIINRNVFRKIVFLTLYFLSTEKRKTSSGLTVLTYHRISDHPDFQNPLMLSLDNFEKQILFLKNNYSIISGEQLAESIKNNKPFSGKACLITFDDGWRDNFTHAFPILKKHGVPAVIFISTDYIGTNKIFWHEQLSNTLAKIPSSLDSEEYKDFFNKWPVGVSKRIESVLGSPSHRRHSLIHDLIAYLKSFDEEMIRALEQELKVYFDIRIHDDHPQILSWEQVEEMAQNNIHFGSHTKTHAILTQINEGRLIDELKQSKDCIEHKLGKPVYFISYPNGNYNESVIRVTIESGYLASFTCVPGTNSSYKHPFKLKRKHIRETHSLGLNGAFSELFFKVELSGIRSSLKGSDT